MQLRSCLLRKKIDIFRWIFPGRYRIFPLDIPDFFRGKNPANSRGKSGTITFPFLRMGPSSRQRWSLFGAKPVRRRDFKKRIYPVGPALSMRFVTEGVPTQHLWLDELERSPFRNLVFCETAGANRHLKPAWLLRCVLGMLLPSLNLGPTLPL